MGQKVNPISFRKGVYLDWDSRWFARDKRTYASNAREDRLIRLFFAEHFKGAEIERIGIEKTNDALRVLLHAARPGVLIGKKGHEMEQIRRKLGKLLGRGNIEVSVQEIKVPELSAQLMARDIADQLERRASHKKAMKKAVSAAMRAGARGVKVRVAGRIGGAEIARDEWVRIGSAPLHTLRSDIDYGFATAQTTYGVIGVKVWVCKGTYKASKE